MLPQAEAMGTTWNMLVPLVSGGGNTLSYEGCIAAEVTDSEENILKPRINLRPSDLTIPSKLRRSLFPIKIVFVITVNKA